MDQWSIKTINNIYYRKNTHSDPPSSYLLHAPFRAICLSQRAWAHESEAGQDQGCKKVRFEIFWGSRKQRVRMICFKHFSKRRSWIVSRKRSNETWPSMTYEAVRIGVYIAAIHIISSTLQQLFYQLQLISRDIQRHEIMHFWSCVYCHFHQQSYLVVLFPWNISCKSTNTESLLCLLCCQSLSNFCETREHFQEMPTTTRPICLLVVLSNFWWITLPMENVLENDGV